MLFGILICAAIVAYGGSSVLNAGMGVAFVDQEPVYIPNALHRVVLKTRLPCYTQLKVSAMTDRWLTVLNETAKWEELATNKVIDASSNLKDYLNEHKSQRQDLIWRIAQITSLYGQIQKGSAGLELITNYTTLCADDEEPGDAGAEEFEDRLREVRALILARTESTVRPSTSSSAPEADPEPPKELSLTQTDHYLKMGDATDLVQTLGYDDLIDLARKDMEFQTLILRSGVWPESAILDWLRANKERFERSRPTRVARLDDQYPGMNIRQNTLYDALVPEKSYNRADVKWMLARFKTNSKKRQVHPEIGQTFTLRQNAICQIISAQNELLRDDTVIAHGNRSILEQPDAVERPSRGSKSKTKSAPMRPSTTTQSSPILPVDSGCYNPFSLTDSESTTKIAMYNKYVKAKRAFYHFAAMNQGPMSFPAVGIYYCYVPSTATAVPYDVREMSCTWANLRSDEDLRLANAEFCPPSYAPNDEPVDERQLCTWESVLDGYCDTRTHITRLSRGVGDFVMDYVWKPMFGSASTRDVDKYSGNLRALANVSRIVDKNTKSVWAKVEVVSGETVKLAEAVASIEKNLAEWNHAATEELVGVQKALENIDEQLKDVTLTVKILSLLQSISFTSSNLLTSLMSVHRYQHQLFVMAQNSLISPEIFSTDLLLDVQKSVESEKYRDLTLPPTWRSKSIFLHRVAEVFVNGLDMALVLEVPLISKSDTYSSYASISVPLEIGGWKSLRPMSDYVVVTTNPNQYAGLSQAEYLACMQSAGRVCHTAVTWVVDNHKDCIASLLFPTKAVSSGADSAELCVFSPVPDSSVIPTAVALSGSQWFVNPANHVCEMSELCVYDNSNTRTTIVVASMAIVDVKPGCECLFCGKYSLNHVDVKLSTYTNPISDDMMPGILITNFTSTIKYSVDSRLDALRNLTLAWRKKSNSTTESLPAGTISGITKALTAVLKDKSTIESTKKAWDAWDRWTETTQASEYVQWIIDMWHYVVPLGLAGVITLCLLVWWYCGRPKASSAVIPGVVFSKLPQSYAAVTALPTTTQAPNATATDAMDAITSALYHVRPETWITISIMTAVMIVIMLIHHCWNRCAMKASNTRLLHRLGYLPLNRVGSHHAGEAPIIVTLLVRFRVLFKPDLIRAVSVQVATLPGLSSDWYRKPNPSPWKLISESTSYRLMRSLKVALDWKAMCLLSHRYPSVDTCADMPQGISIPFNSICWMSSGSLPMLWMSATAVGLSKLEIGRGNDVSVVYVSTDSIPALGPNPSAPSYEMQNLMDS